MAADLSSRYHAACCKPVGAGAVYAYDAHTYAHGAHAYAYGAHAYATCQPMHDTTEIPDYCTEISSDYARDKTENLKYQS